MSNRRLVLQSKSPSVPRQATKMVPDGSARSATSTRVAVWPVESNTSTDEGKEVTAEPSSGLQPRSTNTPESYSKGGCEVQNIYLMCWCEGRRTFPDFLSQYAAADHTDACTRRPPSARSTTSGASFAIICAAALKKPNMLSHSAFISPGNCS